MSIHKTYTKEIYNNLKYRPTWLPGTPMHLGTVGVIEDGIFRAVTSLNNLGIRFEEVVDTDRDSINFSSNKGVTITFKAAGESNSRFKAVADASAGALIEFSREGAVVLQLGGVSFHRISDQAALKQHMMRLVVGLDDDHKWERKWSVVTEVARSESATIVVSNSSNSKLELNASGSSAPASLVDASVDLSVAAESEVSTKVIGKSGLTPLFRAVRVKRPFFSLFDDVLLAESTDPQDVFGEAIPGED